MGQRLVKVADNEQALRGSSQDKQSREQRRVEIRQAIAEIKTVLDRVEDAVPLINLAITTSGANLSTSLSSTVSPSRLLQASTFLTAGDTQYSALQSHSVQIGPTFTLSLYMLFQGHIRPQNEEQVRNTTWQEVIHKARLKLMRVPLESLYDAPDSLGSPDQFNGGDQKAEPRFSTGVRSDEFAYQVVIIEDLDDDRVHTYEEGETKPAPCQDVDQAGIRETIPVHELSKIFYADTGKILNIGSDGESNNPILLLKRDLNAVPPRRMMQRFDDFEDQVIESIEQPSSPPETGHAPKQNIARLNQEYQASSTYEGDQKTQVLRIPSNLDPEWLAFEVYTEDGESDTGSEEGEMPINKPPSSRAQSLEPGLLNGISSLNLNRDSSPSPAATSWQQLVPTPAKPANPVIRTSLSLLEMLLRLLSLQQFQQSSHLSIPDELLNFFLSEAATTGAATGDDTTRRRLRYEARERVGFDPYDESPIKRRGEDYQYRGGTSQSGDAWNEANGQWNSDAYNEDWAQQQPGYLTPHDEGYGTYQFSDLRNAQITDSPSSQLLLKERSHASRGTTPDRSLPPLPRSSSNEDRKRGNLLGSPGTPPSMQDRFRSFQQAGRKGSPLAMPARESPDEGIGLSSDSNKT